MILPTLFCVRKSSLKETFSANVEDEYYNESSIDLISKNPSGLFDCKIEDIAPFDPETRSKMQGLSITPDADEYGQFSSRTFVITPYKPEQDDAIFMWIYLIDVVTFKLKISIYDGSSSTLSWEFDSQQVYEMGIGWKLIKLNLRDFEFQEDYTQKTYEKITFSYLSEAEDFEGEEGYESYDVKTDERFSFYHVFASKNANYSENSGKIYSLAKSYYDFCDNFMTGGTVYKGDKLTIKSARDVFKYLYAGKYDLSNFVSSGRFYWSLSMTDPDLVKTNLEFGDSINFHKTGYYVISISLIQKATITNKTILKVDINLYSDELTLGSFLSGSKYSLKDNEKIMLSFKVSNGVDIDGDYSFTFNNNNAEIDSYYVKDGILYVCVAGKNAGTSKLTVSAKGISKHNLKVQDFSAEATITIKQSKADTDVFLIILWITFGIFVSGFVIYLLISLVKSRKNDVK